MEKERHLPNPSICWVQKPFVEKGDFKPYITSFLHLKDSGDGSSKWRCQNPIFFWPFRGKFHVSKAPFLRGNIYPTRKHQQRGNSPAKWMVGRLSPFLLGFGLFSGAFAVSFRECKF